MNTLIIFLGICSAVASGSKLAVPHKECEKIVGCDYLNGPLLPVQEDVFSIKNIGPSLCTHIYYGSADMNADASVKIDDVAYNIDEFKKVKDFQKKNKQLKILVPISALPQSPAILIEILSKPHLREKFANNVANFLKKFEFNGIEIDVNYGAVNDTQKNGLASNQHNFVLLLKELREKFDKGGLILCIAVGANEAIAKLFDIKGISKYVNFINLNTFDFRGCSHEDRIVRHAAPMYPSKKENAKDRKLNIDYAVKYWLSRGVPPKKLILGTVLYGCTYTLTNPKLIGRGAPISDDSESTSIPPTAGYYEICPLEKNPQWKHLYDEEQQVPYMYNGNQIIGYDNAESITKKAEYIKKMNLGGAMVWGVDGDDFTGECGEKFPLLKTLNRVLENKC